MELRPYQQESVNSVLTKWDEFDQLLGVAPTGSGKTICLRMLPMNPRVEMENLKEDERGSLFSLYPAGLAGGPGDALLRRRVLRLRAKRVARL